MRRIARRTFLRLAGGTTVVVAASASSKTATPAEISEPNIELRAWTAKGQPLPVGLLKQLYFLDLNDEPMPNPSRQVVAGKLFSQPPRQSFAIAAKIPVTGFGSVMLYADNQGKGYSAKDFPLDLNLAFAESRLHRVRTAVSAWQRAGTRFSAQLEERLRQAEASVKEAQTTQAIAAKAKLCNEALRQGLWAGEEAIFAKSQQDIRRHPLRPDFLFGCNFFGHPGNGAEYDRLFKRLFNFATVPFYWQAFEPQPGQPNFAPVDERVNWLRQANITPKGHPLVWFHEVGIPNWLRNKSYTDVKQLTYQRICQISTHYGSKIPYYDIINEANGISWANEFHYSQDQFLELTQLASQAAASGNPQVKRIINNFGLWGEYVARAPVQAGQPGKLTQSPYRYLQRCIAANIPFEIAGFQLYYPNQDMFEINRQLDRYSKLGKPIHITELGVSSATTRDEKSYLKAPEGLWHAPWSEKVQADWVEQFYTLCYSKPYIQAITWWDFADRGNFWPHGGLLQADMTPKEAYHRLANLMKEW